MQIWNHYALCDPRYEGPEAVRYIGRVGEKKGALKRLTEHVKDSENSKSRAFKDHRSRWIRVLRSIGLEPVVVKLGSGGEDREAALIAYWRILGANLTNHTKGGEGTSGLVQTTEHRRKIGEANRQNWTPRMEEALRQSRATGEVREKQRRGHLGIKKVPGSSQFVGVHFHKPSNNWTATLKVGEVRFMSGGHETEEEAAVIRDAAVLHYCGPGAKTNLLPGGLYGTTETD